MAAVAALAAWVAPAGSAGGVAPAPPEFYGIATSTDLQPSDFRRLARANIRTVRFTLSWNAVQQSAGGKYGWNGVDGFVIKASYAGVSLLPTLVGSPKHVSDDLFHPPLDSASDRRGWQDFVRGAVERYGPNGDFWEDVYDCTGSHCHPTLPYMPLRAWQAWNEPNLGTFWHPSPSPERYAQLLQLTGEAVHDVDPGAEVLTGGIMPGGPGAKNSISQNEFITRLYQAGVQESFDGVDLHPYMRKPRGVRRLVQNARAIMQAFGDGGTPLWISEVGWSTRGPKDDDQVTNRKGQAKRLSKTLKMLTKMRTAYGIKLASWFTYRDASVGAYCDWCYGAGLFNKKLKPKPAWRKYAKVTGGKP